MSYIDSSGKYHKENVPLADSLPSATSVFKQADHDRQRADHKMDLINPYNRDGSVNQDFVDAYPLESQEVYHFIKSDEEIAREK